MNDGWSEQILKVTILIMAITNLLLRLNNLNCVR